MRFHYNILYNCIENMVFGGVSKVDPSILLIHRSTKYTKALKCSSQRKIRTIWELLRECLSLKPYNWELHRVNNMSNYYKFGRKTLQSKIQGTNLLTCRARYWFWGYPRHRGQAIMFFNKLIFWFNGFSRSKWYACVCVCSFECSFPSQLRLHGYCGPQGQCDIGK